MLRGFPLMVKWLTRLAAGLTPLGSAQASEGA